MGGETAIGTTRKARTARRMLRGRAVRRPSDRDHVVGAFHRGATRNVRRRARKSRGEQADRHGANGADDEESPYTRTHFRPL